MYANILILQSDTRWVSCNTKVWCTVTRIYTSCNGWTHMLLDVTGQMRYCCRRSRCFLISDTSWRLWTRFCLSLSLPPSFPFALHPAWNSHRIREISPPLVHVQETLSYALSERANFSPGGFGPAKNHGTVRSHVSLNTVCSGFSEVFFFIWSICLAGGVCQGLGGY